MINCGFKEDEIVKIVQTKNKRISKGIKKYATYLIWLKGEETIRKALLSVTPLIKGDAVHWFFKWPYLKGKEITPVSESLFPP